MKRRESRLRDAAGATADTTAAYYGAGRRYDSYIATSRSTIFTIIKPFEI